MLVVAPHHLCADKRQVFGEEMARAQAGRHSESAEIANGKPRPRSVMAKVDVGPGEPPVAAEAKPGKKMMQASGFVDVRMAASRHVRREGESERPKFEVFGDAFVASLRPNHADGDLFLRKLDAGLGRWSRPPHRRRH